jgi:hypothetical protein
MDVLSENTHVLRPVHTRIIKNKQVNQRQIGSWSRVQINPTQ